MTQAITAWRQAESSYAATDLQADRDWTRLWLTPDCFDSVRAVIYAATGRGDDGAVIAQALTARLAGALGKSDAVSLINAALALAAAGKFTTAANAGRQALQAVRAAEATGCMPRASVVAEMIRDRGRLTSSSRAYIEDVEATQRHLDSLQMARASR